MNGSARGRGLAVRAVAGEIVPAGVVQRPVDGAALRGDLIGRVILVAEQQPPLTVLKAD